MPVAPFSPCYIFESELASYGLPTADEKPDIMKLVEMASSYVDEVCGRIDGDGNGSLVYTTYTQRMLLQTRNRNLIMLPLKPITGIPSSTITELQNLARSKGNNYDTGAIPNTITLANGQLSGIVSASGRYGYTRQDMSIAYPDLFAFINPLNLVTMFGGPAPWVSIDVANCDYSSQTGEIWLPAGLQLQRYSEVWITYNSGYDPRYMPRQIKFVTASLTKNVLVKGSGVTALMSLNIARSGANASFYQDLLDPTLDRFLTPFKTVRAY